jgi:hypothetical protein
MAELKLELPLQDLVTNKIKIPILSDYKPVNEYWYPHPPCLVPLFLGAGASYKGIVCHFFFERKKTFAEYYLENGYLTEYAMDFKQLATLLILSMVTIKEELTDEIIKFAEAIGYKEYEAVDRFSVDHGDDPAYFNELVYFKEALPLKYIKEISAYTGDFPSSINNINIKQIQKGNACSIELSNTAKEYIGKAGAVFPWLDNGTDKKELFSGYIEKGQLKEAWLTLNANGWLLKDVNDCLEIFKTKTKDTLFHLVADYWIEGWKNSSAQDQDKY